MNEEYEFTDLDDEEYDSEEDDRDFDGIDSYGNTLAEWEEASKRAQAEGYNPSPKASD